MRQLPWLSLKIGKMPANFRIPGIFSSIFKPCEKQWTLSPLRDRIKKGRWAANTETEKDRSKRKGACLLMKNKSLYGYLMMLSIILIALSLTVLKDTKFIAPIVIAISGYLFFGAMMKLCKSDDQLKNNLFSILDVLFWLP